MCPYTQGHPPKTVLCLNTHYPWRFFPLAQALPSPDSPSPPPGTQIRLTSKIKGRVGGGLQVPGGGRGIRGGGEPCSPYCAQPLPSPQP